MQGLMQAQGHVSIFCGILKMKHFGRSCQKSAVWRLGDVLEADGGIGPGHF